jgi:hypothetical protein
MKTIYEVLLERHEADVASCTQFLASGGPKDFSEYKEVVGRIRGLQLAIQVVMDLERLQEHDDDL